MAQMTMSARNLFGGGTPRVVSPHLRKTDPDQYGQEHPIETPELISSSLSLLVVELANIRRSDRQYLVEAEEKYPELAKSDEHRILFLRCEMFNVDLAALRLTKYWKQRIELFGGKAFAPLTVDDTLKDDISALELGFVRLLSGKDHGGRGLVYVEPCCLGNGGYDYTSMVRATWYVLHVALEAKTIQQKGVVFIVNNQNTDAKLHFDKKLIQMNAEAVRGILPVRVGGIHICHPSNLFSTLAPVMKFMLGPRLGKRINVHSGSEDAILDTLSSRYGIRPEAVPAALGGFTTVNQHLWLEDRREVESAVEATFVKAVEEESTEDAPVDETNVEIKTVDEGTTDESSVEEGTEKLNTVEGGKTEEADGEEVNTEEADDKE